VVVSTGEEQSQDLQVAWEGWNLYRFSLALWALLRGRMKTGKMDIE
jgi:hypothetical protein